MVDDPHPEDLLATSPLARPTPPRDWRERLEHLADATGSTPSRIVLGAVAVVLAGAGALWLLRPPSDPPEVSLPFASTTAPSTATGPAVTDSVVVHVTGAVRTPGVYDLPAGSRVVDAVEAAGGLSAAADPSRVNLAAPLSDGQRVYVLAAGEEVAPTAPGDSASGPGAQPAGPVDLNTADAPALEALPGIGPATAAAILEHRAKVGRFTSVEQLLDVPGIGEAKLEALRDLVTV